MAWPTVPGEPPRTERILGVLQMVVGALIWILASIVVLTVVIAAARLCWHLAWVLWR